jgi:hypothetical protein
MPLFTNKSIYCLLFNGVSGDLKEDRVPEEFSKLLLEKYRNYGSSRTHREAFRYFATRILPAVNSSHTRYDKRRYKESLSECFSYTDEAFGLLLVVNYEERWQSQHAAERRLPDGTSQDRSALWEDARYTSATEGARRGASWPKEGLVKFNELSAMVRLQRDNGEEQENGVEKDLMDWCREDAGLPPMAKGAGKEAPQVDHGEVDEEEEVEAVGECGIFEV